MIRLVAVMLVLIMDGSVVLADDALPPGDVGGHGAVPAWWSEQDAGWLGGLVGGSVGILGAIFGVTAGLGRARSTILALALILVGAGLVLLAVGLIAVATGQPYHVYFLFFVIGGVLTFVMGFNYPMLRRRYDQIEFQCMQAMDS
jgi:hypothetical protein